jgi:hypothetical protein
MEFISSETGQSLQLIRMDEIRPLRGGIFLPDLTAEIKARYRFLSVPTQFEPNQTRKFEGGVREIDGLTITILSLEIYGDGVAINSHNTDDADAVLDDFFGWIAERYRFREPRSVISRKYYSRIVVDFDDSAGETFIQNFKSLSAIVTRSVGSERSLELTQLNFGPEPPGELPNLFTWTFQPRIGQPYVPHRYFSAAPLSTSAHIEMLRELEAAATVRIN